MEVRFLPQSDGFTVVRGEECLGQLKHRPRGGFIFERKRDGASKMYASLQVAFARLRRRFGGR